MNLRAMFEKKKNPAEPEAEGQELLLDDLIISDEPEEQFPEIQDEIKPSYSAFIADQQAPLPSSEIPACESFYSRYLLQIRSIKSQWQQEVEEMSISELFEVIKNRYSERTPHELSAYGDFIKDEMCKYAEAELRKRAKRNEGKKTSYHILGELLCRSFSHNNRFPGKNRVECDELVEWIRERYTYIYANLAQDNFKTECKSALDMVAINPRLREPLIKSYPSIEKKLESYVSPKKIKLEEQMLQYLDYIISSHSSCCSPTSYQQTPTFEHFYDGEAEEMESEINKKYKAQNIGYSEW